MKQKQSTKQQPVEQVRKEVPDVPLCASERCNHKKNQRKVKFSKSKIENLDDLIEFCNMYQCKNNVKYHGLDMSLTHRIVQPLRKLHNIIGLTKVKQQITDQLVFLMQGMNEDNMLHSIITGPPGCGKTTLAQILSEIYSIAAQHTQTGIIHARRSDLIAKYTGQTAIKTQQVIDKAKGGVLFIDEAYSLGVAPGENLCYSKECIDTLNQNLTERRDFVCILAGYKKDIQNNFMALNPGLERRFPFRYDIEGYTHEEMFEIFKHQITRSKRMPWKINENDVQQIQNEFFNKESMKLYPNYGGDIENCIMRCKIHHGKRTLIENKDKFTLSYDDIKKGMQDR